MRSERWVTRLFSCFALTLAMVQIVRIARQAWTAMPTLWDDIHVPYALNFWSDQPIFIQVNRIASGWLPYRSVYWGDSWTYGPYCPYLMAAADRLVESRPTAILLHEISMWIGFATIVPLLAALVAIRLRAQDWRSASGWVATAVAGALTVISFFLLDTRAITFTALHPDVVTFLAVASAAAGVAWARFVPRPRFLLIGIAVVCFASALSKFNTAPMFAFS